MKILMTDRKPKPPLIGINAAIFVGLPLAALILVPAWGIYHGFDAFQWLWALAFLYLNGMSITGGYHRLWAHKSYEAGPVLKSLFALWGAGALQNSILVWASDHRRHHRQQQEGARAGTEHLPAGEQQRRHLVGIGDFRRVDRPGV